MSDAESMYSIFGKEVIFLIKLYFSIKTTRYLKNEAKCSLIKKYSMSEKSAAMWSLINFYLILDGNTFQLEPKDAYTHRVDRVLDFFSSRPNWDFPGGYTLACGRGGGGGSQFRRGDRHCGTLGLYVLCA